MGARPRYLRWPWCGPAVVSWGESEWLPTPRTWGKWTPYARRPSPGRLTGRPPLQSPHSVSGTVLASFNTVPGLIPQGAP